jgi:hypothetical protein
MKNSQTNKPPITISVHRAVFWSVVGVFSYVVITTLYLMYGVLLPKSLQNTSTKFQNQNQALLKENSLLKKRNDELLIENGSIRQNLEDELLQLAELQAQANIVDKIKKESLEEITKYDSKLQAQNKQIEFYKELMSPSIKQELQCFNMNVTNGDKYVDYGINLVLDDKDDDGKSYDVEFRLLSGKDNVEITKVMPEDLAPDTIRQITLKNSIRLTGKIKHNNKLNGLKVLDVRVFNKSKKLAAQCWKVF